MLFVSSEVRDLVIDYVRRRIGLIEFKSRFASISRDPVEFVLDGLRRASQSRDADDVFYCIAIGGIYELRREWFDSLKSLAAEKWHESHEEIVFKLAEFADPSCVKVFFEIAIEQDRRDLDDTSSVLAKKCIYGISKVNDASAVRSLGILAASRNRVLRDCAIERLRVISVGGASDDLRALACDELVGCD